MNNILRITYVPGVNVSLSIVAMIAGIVSCNGGVEHNITVVGTTDESVTAPGEMAFAMIPGRST